MKEYGHKHLDLFYQKIFQMDQETIRFKGKIYNWSSIKNIQLFNEGEISGDLFESTYARRLKISLHDGNVITLNERVLVCKNEKRNISFVDGKNSIFEELIDFITRLNNA